MTVATASSAAPYAEGDELAAFERLTERLNELSATFRDVRGRMLYVRAERRRLMRRWHKRMQVEAKRAGATP